MSDTNSGVDLEKKNPTTETEELTEEEAEFLADEAGLMNESVTEAEDKPEITQDPSSITLPSGKAMFMGEAVRLAANRKHKVVLIAGAPKSGKTSLISDIFVSFQNGEFSHLLFAGSHTLMGFEEKCWNARTIALPRIPQTKRTSRQDPTYLQLSIQNSTTRRRQDFLICDISGEVFKDAASSTEVCEAIKDIAWVDHFVLVMDGEKLASLTEREFVATQAEQILLRLLDSKVLSRNSLIGIVFSKSDKLDLGKGENERFIKRIEEEFHSALKSRGVKAEFFSTSAHNIYGHKDKPFDLTKLLTFWMSNDKMFNIQDTAEPSPEITNELERFALRETTRK